MKNLLIIAIAAFAFTACNNSPKAEETATDSTAMDSTLVAPVTETAPVATDSTAMDSTAAHN
jgi:uncharacterized protein YcfL